MPAREPLPPPPCHVRPPPPRPAAPSAPLREETVAALRGCANRFGREAAARKAALLRECAACAMTDPGALLAYHDCLLFLLAYPESAALRAQARRELERVADAARGIIDAGPARARARLAKQRRRLGADDDRLRLRHRALARPALSAVAPRSNPSMTPERRSRRCCGMRCRRWNPSCWPLNEAASEDLLQEASAGHRGTRLSWLVAQIARLPCSEGLREQLFDSLHAYVTIAPGATALSRTFVRGLPVRTHFHRRALQRDVDPPAILASPLAPARKLERAARERLLDAGRAMLASLGRETDAIAAADPDGVEHHELGRGVAIALYTMAPGPKVAARLPRRFHALQEFGADRLRRRLAVSGHREDRRQHLRAVSRRRIGVPFLPGAARLSATLRRRPFRRRAVAVRRRQPRRPRVGRLLVLLPAGVPPRCSRHRRVGRRRNSSESLRDPGYRAPLPVLRRFTRSDIEFRLDEGASALPPCDPADLSLAASAWIARRFRGDRGAALAFAVRRVSRALGVRGASRWPEAEQAAYQSFCLLLAQIPGLGRWPASDKARAVALARAKGGDEFRYYDLLRSHWRLAAALRNLAARQSLASGCRRASTSSSAGNDHRSVVARRRIGSRR